ncbi:uncharacterized protein LOC143297203 [Babylonia areolata]|uniref:uncharacterized protein LOC143297203 n=1 Tax=Babylonia areolata TaxID=304850 RepID=UPI003FD52B40
MADRHIPPRCVVVLLSVLVLTGRGSTQGVRNDAAGQAPGATPLPQKDSLEETVLEEMLRIVDQKFDSLSARISVLERSVNSLNFYSVRQFREIADSIETSTATMEGLRAHLGKVDRDTRSVKAAVSHTGRDINVIKSDVIDVKSDVKVVKTDVGAVKKEVEVLTSDSLKMFDDIANSIVYFNENVGEKTDDLKAMMKEAVSTMTVRAGAEDEDSTVIIRHLQDLDLTRPRNCNVNFRPLEERIDLRFAEMKRQTHTHFVDLINAGTSDSESEQQKSTDSTAEPTRTPEAENEESEREGGGRDGEKVMRLLANMTQNVMEAVSYFRHTGAMMERLLHTTHTIKEEQSRLRYDVVEASRLLSTGHTEGAEVLFEDLISNLPEGADLSSAELGVDSQEQEKRNLLERADNGKDRGSKLRPEPFPIKTHAGQRPATPFGSAPYYTIGSREGPPHLPPDGGLGMKEVVEESLRVLSELTKNGTQLLDVLTDLAQLSSNTLTHSVTALHTEVQRLEDVRVSLNQGLPSPGKASGDVALGQESSAGSGAGGDLRSLHNTTKTIFSIVEAIASNTGWIPYIFHNMQLVERLTNRTLELTKRSMATRWNHPHGNEVPIPLTQDRQLGQDGVSQVQALDLIYDTSVRLQKIMPALTRLVAEPEPLMALAEGKSPQEGRVEIFHKGQWGAVCRLDMGHSEASAICKHLGYVGGVWAGTDHFGRGRGGRHWLLNVTCLHSQLCPLVMQTSHSVNCPSGHFAVICDHMVRMTHIPGINDVKTGLVSVHHQGRWLPVCSHGWSGYEARVACKQMGFPDGREFLHGDMPWREVLGEVVTWVTGVGCTGEEDRLDACEVDSYSAQECTDTDTPAAVRCQ